MRPLPLLALLGLVGGGLPEAGAATASAGSGGASSSVPLALPPELPYATIRLFGGVPGEQVYIIRTLTESGRLLIDHNSNTTAYVVQSGDLLAYRWHEGIAEEIRAPASPWIYQDLAAPDALSYQPRNMNESGAVIGFSYWGGMFEDSETNSGSPELRYRVETLALIWPAGGSNNPVLLPPGISDPVERLTHWSRTDFRSNVFIDSAGVAYAHAIIDEDVIDSSSNQRLLSDDVLKWSDWTSAWTKLTDNVASAPARDRLQAVSSSGNLLYLRQNGTGYVEYRVSGKTFPGRFSPAYEGYEPRDVNDAGRFVGYDHTAGKIGWGSASEELAYLEGTAAAEITNSHDILGSGLTSVRKLWRWMEDGQGGYAYRDFLIGAAHPPTDDLFLIKMNSSGLIAGYQYRNRDLAGNPLGAGQHSWTTVLLAPAELAVDANHDGDITRAHENVDPLLSDLTTPTTPFRWWSNDDDDAPGSTPQADYLSGAVDGADDLTDFFPLFLDIKQLLGVLPPSTSIRYKLKQAEGGLNFAYTSLTRGTAFNYLTDTASTYGPNADQAAAVATTQQITAAGVELPAAFLTRIKDQEQGVILLELRGMTAAPLRLVVERDGIEIAEVAANIATGEIEWLSLYADNPVEDFKVPTYYADYTTKPLQWLEGLRYFSDGADKNATFLRNSVYVKVKMAGAAGKTISLKAFDVDDPTPSDWDPENVIDFNDATSGPAGNDNIGLGGVFLSSYTRSATAALDSNGEATVEFVTSPRPGANFRVAAVLNDAAGQLAALQITNANAARYVSPDSRPVPGFAGVTSPTLTIWRKLHIEVDSMAAAPDPIPENLVTGTINSFTDLPTFPGYSGASVRLELNVNLPDFENRFEYGNLSVAGFDLLVRGNSNHMGGEEFTVPDDTVDVFKAGGITAAQLVGQTFTLTDDDNRFNDLHGWQPHHLLPDAHAVLLQPARVKYAPAFIEIIDASAAGLNPNRTVTFKLNESADGHSLNLIPDVYNDAIDVEGTEFFWAHAIVFGLQPKSTEDMDPYSESQLFGGTPYTFAADGWRGLGYSAIYVESHREEVMFRVMPDLIYNPTANFFDASAVASRADQYRRLLAGTIAHEIGHGPTSGHTDDHNDGGLMGDGGESIEVDFSAASVLRFRSTKEWK